MLQGSEQSCRQQRKEKRGKQRQEKKEGKKRKKEGKKKDKEKEKEVKTRETKRKSATKKKKIEKEKKTQKIKDCIVGAEIHVGFGPHYHSQQVSVQIRKKKPQLGSQEPPEGVCPP